MPAAGAAAPQLAPTAPPEHAAPQPAAVFQGSLFGPQAVPRVLDMPEPRVEKRAAPQKRAAKRGQAGTLQQSLDLLPSPIETGLRVSGDTVIQCSARVAPLVLRALAAALDASMVLCALGLLLATLTFGGVEVVIKDRTSMIVFGIAAGSVGLLYKVLFVIANGDTVGVRALRMRVVNFDGRRPTTRQRLYRFAAGWLSVLAAMLGLLWALVDEESLTWHDHVSKTFPTAAAN